MAESTNLMDDDGIRSVNLTLNCEKWSADGSVKMPACSKTAAIKHVVQLHIKIGEGATNTTPD